MELTPSSLHHVHSREHSASSVSKEIKQFQVFQLLFSRSSNFLKGTAAEELTHWVFLLIKPLDFYEELQASFSCEGLYVQQKIKLIETALAFTRNPKVPARALQDEKIQAIVTKISLSQDKEKIDSGTNAELSKLKKITAELSNIYKKRISDFSQYSVSELLRETQKSSSLSTPVKIEDNFVMIKKTPFDLILGCFNFESSEIMGMESHDFASVFKTVQFVRMVGKDLEYIYLLLKSQLTSIDFCETESVPSNNASLAMNEWCKRLTMFVCATILEEKCEEDCVKFLFLFHKLRDYFFEKKLFPPAMAIHKGFSNKQIKGLKSLWQNFDEKCNVEAQNSIDFENVICNPETLRALFEKSKKKGEHACFMTKGYAEEIARINRIVKEVKSLDEAAIISFSKIMNKILPPTKEIKSYRLQTDIAMHLANVIDTGDNL